MVEPRPDQGPDFRAAPGAAAEIEPFVHDLQDVGVATSFRDFWQRFNRNKLAVAGVAIIVFWVLLAIFGPLFVADPTDPRAVDFAAKFQMPFTAGHILGTDHEGRDLLARTIYAARVSMIVGIVATIISIVIGVALGSIAGYFGRWPDTVIMRFADIFFAFPYILGTIAIVTALEAGGVVSRGLVPVVLSVGILSWAFFARLLRGQLLSLRNSDYVTAAHTFGAGASHIIRRHLLPNAMPILIVYAALNIGEAVLAEAALSFLGAGIQEPQASWGLMLNSAVDALGTDNFYMVPPGLALASVVFAFIMIGDGLRDALDPRMKEVGA